ncbi:type II toxin-antitoxin system RelE/ParE family toxin [Seleniivibrio sp.]|uniref:type II toxin-antitoxin system RelE/ParE family toxin n=1 Tax=Seleniivibrio sp. TaxID=2898801 RepID=UPI0025D3F26E|nr:type II toxin-antitoxin system RelE/ParE family toxin [Seleniivibrio sp.]MCD8553771.1 type II toxin-antitoxin system RelE/ParE family toxin [Seleniivibrio sp.]
MHFKVIWSEPARNDLRSLVEYISYDDKETARRIGTEIYEAVGKLSELPNRSRLVPELRLYNNISFREILISVWRVIFTVMNDTVLVYAVLDSRQNVSDILSKRLVL